jgi:hypothetical protein
MQGVTLFALRTESIVENKKSETVRFFTDVGKFTVAFMLEKPA